MKKGFVVSLVVGSIPTVVLTTMAFIMAYMQHGNMRLVLIKFQAGYEVLLLLASILFSILKKEGIAGGLLASFFVGLVVFFIRYVGWGF